MVACFMATVTHTISHHTIVHDCACSYYWPGDSLHRIKCKRNNKPKEGKLLKRLKQKNEGVQTHNIQGRLSTENHLKLQTSNNAEERITNTFQKNF